MLGAPGLARAHSRSPHALTLRTHTRSPSHIAHYTHTHFKQKEYRKKERKTHFLKKCVLVWVLTL